jgi:hypothetical protein
MASKEQQLEWGRLLAEAYRFSFPAIAFMLIEQGLAVDPTPLVHLFDNQSPELQNAIMTVIAAMLATINGSYEELNKAYTAISTEAQDLHTTIQQNNTDRQRYTDIIEELRNTVRVQATAKANATPPTIPIHSRRLSKDPEKFTGDDTDTKKRQQIYTVWKAQLRLCHAQDGAIFHDDRSQILHILTNMAGKAFEANRLDIENCITHPLITDTWKWKTCDELFEALDSQYQIINMKLEASMKFDKLFQKNTPYPNFLSEFISLAAQCGKTEIQKVEQLKKKVSTEIGKMLTGLVNRPKEDDFTGWSSIAGQFWESTQEFEHNQRSRGRSDQQPQNNYQQNKSQQPTLTTSNGGDAMDLSKVFLGKMTDEQRGVCRQMGLCYYCKEPGHTTSQCEKKKAADQKRFNNLGGSFGSFQNTARGGYSGQGFQGQQAQRGGLSSGRGSSQGGRGSFQGGRGGFQSGRGGTQGGSRGGYSNFGNYSNGYLRSMDDSSSMDDTASTTESESTWNGGFIDTNSVHSSYQGTEQGLPPAQYPGKE